MERKPRAPRIQRHCWAKVHVDGQWVETLVADFSRSGVRIVEPDARFVPGDPIQLEIRDENGSGPAIRLRGTVSRLTRDGYAIRFAVSRADRPRWMDYLRRLTTA